MSTTPPKPSESEMHSDSDRSEMINSSSESVFAQKGTSVKFSIGTTGMVMTADGVRLQSSRGLLQKSRKDLRCNCVFWESQR